MNRNTRGERAATPKASTPKSLFKRVERTLDAIEQAADIPGTIRNVAEYMTENFHEELGIVGGRMYRMDEFEYELIHVFGSANGVPLGTRVPRSYAAVETVLDSGVVVMERNAPELDPAIEAQLGTRERFAAISVADGDYLLSFDVSVGQDNAEDLQASLNIVRLAINQKLRKEKFEEILQDARRIQESILPKRTPRHTGFDIAGQSRPTELVGGDFYDYIPLAPDVVDLVIADASGHGLPAALQVRDVYVGLRMGLTREFKLSRTVERLNSIINRSKLASKFVSMFLAELETSGHLMYINAGHNPPFILHAGGTVEYLREGGMVLGPLPDARYLRGFAHLSPGDILVLYTDGITECRHHRSGEEFGVHRLQSHVRRNAQRPAAEILKAVFEAVGRFVGDLPQEDDQTLVVVSRPVATA